MAQKLSATEGERFRWYYSGRCRRSRDRAAAEASTASENVMQQIATAFCITRRSSRPPPAYNTRTAPRRRSSFSTLDWWTGACGTPEVREFNAGNDVEAINYVLNSGVNFWQIPNDVYGKMRISLAEIERRIAPCGEIGRHLFENMETYNHSEHAGWTAGESWTLGDSPAVGVVLDPDCGFYHETEAPIILDDTTNKFEKGRPKIRVYTSVDSRFILEDFIAKLEILYGKGFRYKNRYIKHV